MPGDADLPVEATRFEFVIHLKIATMLGFMVPRSLFLRAHEGIV